MASALCCENYGIELMQARNLETVAHRPISNIYDATSLQECWHLLVGHLRIKRRGSCCASAVVVAIVTSLGTDGRHGTKARRGDKARCDPTKAGAGRGAGKPAAKLATSQQNRAQTAGGQADGKARHDPICE